MQKGNLVGRIPSVAFCDPFGQIERFTEKRRVRSSVRWHTEFDLWFLPDVEALGFHIVIVVIVLSDSRVAMLVNLFPEPCQPCAPN